MKKDAISSEIEKLGRTTALLKQRADKANRSFQEQFIESQRLASQTITLLQERTVHITRLNQALEAAVTGRALAEKALDDSTRRRQATADAVPILVWEAGPDKDRAYFNKRWLEFTGRTAKQELRNGWLKGVHPDDLPRFLETYTSAFERRESFTGEYRLRHHSGRYRWILDQGEPLFGLSGTFLAYVGGCIDIHDRKVAETALRRSRQELRTLAARLQAGQEEERAQLAREIHDELSGTLTALKMHISLLPDRALKNQTLFLEKLNSMSGLIDESLTRLRSIVSGLRPVVLDKFGLLAAIEWQTSEFQSRSEITCEIHLPTKEVALDADRATAVFRIFQEALTNVARHAEATRVIVELKTDGGNLLLSVRDNGKGLSDDLIKAPTSIGLLSMRERALSFGGATEITSTLGAGTLVSLRIPPVKPRRR